MSIQIVFETHSISEDNERGIATGWNHGQLSEKGCLLAKELGARRRNDGIQVIFTSDLRRLRECDYGDQNSSMSTSELHRARHHHIDEPYPSGESWRQAINRVGRFLDDLPLRWEGSRVLVIGHVATRWGFEHYLNGVSLENLIAAEFIWRPGWEYRRQ